MTAQDPILIEEIDKITQLTHIFNCPAITVNFLKVCLPSHELLYNPQTAAIIQGFEAI